MQNQANSKGSRDFIKNCENKIQILTTQLHLQQEHIKQLRHEFYDVTTKSEQETKSEQGRILREITRTQRGIALFDQMINFEKDEIRRKISEDT